MNTSDESEISDICDRNEKTHISTGTKPRRPKSSNIRQRIRARYDDDPPYVSPFPSSTSQWSTHHLNSLRIFYDDFPSPIESLLDMIYKETDMFHPLTDMQRDIVKQLQDRMTFSCEFSDVLEFASMSSLNIKPNPNVYEDILKHVEEEDLLWNENTR